MVTTFGIEEEFVLLDPETLTPVECAAQAVAVLADGRCDGSVAREFLCAQVEYATPVCGSTSEARDALLGFRRRLADWAADAGVIAAGTGTPFRGHALPTISPGERYAEISSEVTALTGDHQIGGLHVHVGVDREAGVRASNALRGWLPILLALSGNSPFWAGRDTGYDSWRAIHSRRWTTYGIPPLFRDADDYDEVAAALVGIGATTDPRGVNWNMRLSTRYPTLEVRVCDVQLDAESSIALAVVIRALVESALEPDSPPTLDRAPWDAALWHAARHGLRGTLVHPHTGRLVPAAEVLSALHDRIAPHLRGDDEVRVAEGLLERPRSGAVRQREAHRAGIPALARLYRESLAR
ncbi:Putative glutamate--cysteine ligase 2-2 [Microbacterium sp. 8M]|uniref:carboxylate-amine ligase n=1 Tax=Microbacterium sp. 8M TaxID=2653153 RepID=UPI0012EF0700|nr:YbdK family carboxylate-amine ligase [Microbacterium sp. 8M]VXB77590.1 Putative glutamate--cysteine ligase 2-2 [Microbacterium sp. 8M]